MGKISRVAPRNVGVEVESELKSVSGSCNGSREIKLAVFLRKHNWVHEKESGTRNGQMKMASSRFWVRKIWHIGYAQIERICDFEFPRVLLNCTRG